MTESVSLTIIEKLAKCCKKGGEGVIECGKLLSAKTASCVNGMKEFLKNPSEWKYDPELLRKKFEQFAREMDHFSKGNIDIDCMQENIGKLQHIVQQSISADEAFDKPQVVQKCINKLEESCDSICFKINTKLLYINVTAVFVLATLTLIQCSKLNTRNKEIDIIEKRIKSYANQLEELGDLIDTNNIYSKSDLDKANKALQRIKNGLLLTAENIKNQKDLTSAAAKESGILAVGGGLLFFGNLLNAAHLGTSWATAIGAVGGIGITLTTGFICMKSVEKYFDLTNLNKEITSLLKLYDEVDNNIQTCRNVSKKYWNEKGDLKDLRNDISLLELRLKELKSVEKMIQPNGDNDNNHEIIM
eukprot:345676_1